MKKISYKRIFILIAMVVLSIHSKAQDKEAQASTITFNKVIHDFGAIDGSVGKASATFILENVGDKPVLILQVQTSCGCTVPEYSREPILPKEKSEIKVVYSTIGRIGQFEKTIQILTNGNPPTSILTIKGTVVKDAAPQQ